MPDTGVPSRFTVHVVDFPDKAASYEFYSVRALSEIAARIGQFHADFLNACVDAVVACGDLRGSGACGLD